MKTTTMSLNAIHFIWDTQPFIDNSTSPFTETEEEDEEVVVEEALPAVAV